MSKVLTERDLMRSNTIRINMSKKTVISLLRGINYSVELVEPFMDLPVGKVAYKIGAKLIVPKDKSNFKLGFEYIELTQVISFASNLENDMIRKEIKNSAILRLLYEIKEKFGVMSLIDFIIGNPVVYQNSLWMQEYLKNNPLYTSIL